MVSALSFDMAGEQLDLAGSGEEQVSQNSGCPCEQEIADPQSQSSSEEEIETASHGHSNGSIPVIASLTVENLQRTSDGVRPKPANSRPHSAPPELAHAPRTPPTCSRLVDPALLNERLSYLFLPTPSLSPPGNFFPPLNSPSPSWLHSSCTTLVDSESDVSRILSSFEMYHFPQPPDLRDQYEQRMEEYHSRLLDQVLVPTECPLGSDAETRVCPHNAVVLVENIPYTVTRQEVVQFFGRNARLAEGFPVHIIMERSTGKTMDCYVEFASAMDADAAVHRIKRMHDISQGPRMGNRYVDVSLSSQEALMKALFPRAKCIKWECGRPVQVPKREDEEWSTGFVGFLTDEELFCVGRHAREPHRSAYAVKVPQRAYESIISTIWKFPWYATHMYTVHARTKIYATLKTMIEVLVERLSGAQTVGLDTRLLSELVRAGLECPAFNPRMKYCLAEASEDQDILRRMHPVWLAYFPFDTLTWLRPHNPVALEFYGKLIAKGRTACLPQGLTTSHPGADYPHPYGEWWYVWLDAVAKEKVFSDAIHDEKQVLRSLLTTGHRALQAERRALPSVTANFPRPGSASVDTQPGGVALIGSPQLQRSSAQATQLGTPQHQGRQAHWPSLAPNPYVAGAVPLAPARAPVPSRASAPSPAQAPVPAPVSRRPPGPPGPRGPHGPHGPGNWRGNSSGGSRRVQ